MTLGLADALLPGGAGFPAFSATGAGGLLLRRLPREIRARLDAARGDGAGWIGAGWIGAAAGIEALEPELFAEFRKQAYLAYYEQPEVIGAIRALGHPYNDAPLPEGYPAAASDPGWAPGHGRGRWVDTDDVCRVDVVGLGLGGAP